MGKGGWSFVVAGRVALLLVAATVAVSAFALAARRDRGTCDVRARYVCPMHSAVAFRAPGECPICRMALVARSVPNAPGPRTRPVTDVARRQRIASAVRVPAWFEGDGRVVAVLYEDDRMGLAAGARGRFFRAARPTDSWPVRLVPEPVVPRDGSTSWVRFGLGAKAPGLAHGDVGWIELEKSGRDLLVVPADAVVTSTRGPSVLVLARDGGIAERAIEIGRTTGPSTAVLSGLHENDTVVVGSVFFWNAENRMRRLPGAGAP